MKINLNISVKVKLTKLGAEKYNTYQHNLYEEYFINNPKYLKEGDELKEPLWELMNIFHDFRMGFDSSVFENNEIELKNV